MPTNRPTGSARNKAKIDDLLEVRARRELCPVLPSVAGIIEDHSIGCPSMLPIHKVDRTEDGSQGHRTLPGRPSIVSHVDVRLNASARDVI